MSSNSGNQTNVSSTSGAKSSTRSSSVTKEVVTTTSTATSGKATPFHTARESLYTIRNGAGAPNRSPISPSRITRLQEKEEMQNLNDRLVIYIDTVRRLESENARLQSIVYSYNETSTRDVSEIKVLYERELEDAKKLIDELAKDKAKFEIEVNKYKADAEEALAKLFKREKELKNLESRLKTSESETFEFKSRYEVTQADAQRKQEELHQLRPQVADLEKQLAKLKKQLEDETLLRVDLENKNQTMKEDLQFKSQIYDKEIDQLRSSKRVEIEQVDVRLRDEYDSRLVSELQRIREETEFKILEMKEEVERRYQNKLNDVEATAKRHLQMSTSAREELISYKSKVEELQSEIKSLLAKIANNENKIKELEDKLRKANQKYEKDILEKDTELINLRKELQDLLLEYQELYDIKIALDMEISAYRKLLESEEQRLNISSTMHSQLGASYIDNNLGTANVLESTISTRSGKKRRMATPIDQDESLNSSTTQFQQSHKSTCGIDISEHDFEGKCVRLVNTADKDINISGWQIRRNADDVHVDYKFPKATTIKAGESISVWGSAVGVAAGPSDFVMSNNTAWSVGDNMITILQSKDDKEQARRESKRNSVVLEKRLRATPTRSSTSTTTTTTTEVKATSSSAQGSQSAVQKLFNLWKN